MEICISIENLKNLGNKEISIDGEIILPEEYFANSPANFSFVGSIKHNTDYILEGNLSGYFFSNCSLCLDELKVEFSEEIYEVFSKDNNDENSVIGHKIDLFPLFNSVILSNLSMQYLCKEDCLGLCNQCGVNLNHNTCDCEPDIDPRLAGLKDLTF